MFFVYLISRYRSKKKILFFCSLLYFNKAERAPKLLFYYLVLSGLINLAAIILASFNIQNLPLLHLYTIVEAVFILSYFRTIFVDPLIKRALLIITVLFPVVCILNFSLLQSIYTFNTHTRPLEAILITFFCMLYLYKSGFTENWLSKPINWFNIGILVYFPAACLIFIVSNYIVFKTMNKHMNMYIWNTHAALSMLMYLIWAKGFSLLKHG
jgi:hypothetical protein